MAEQTFKKETCWGNNKNDFVGEDEILVTITLCEYRELVAANAKHAEELRKANERANEEASKARALRDKLDKLLEAASGKEAEIEVPF